MPGWLDSAKAGVEPDVIGAVERQPAMPFNDDGEAGQVVGRVADAPGAAPGDRLGQSGVRAEQGDDVAEGVHLDDP